MTKRQAERFLRAVVALREGAGDQQASASAEAYPGLHGDGRLIRHSTRINRGGRLCRARTDLFDTEENTPEKAPDLWEKLAYENGFRVIPAEIEAGSPFMKGERGYFKGQLYESLLDHNVWTPEQMPSYWKEA